MGLDNGYGVGLAGLKPGVCTSTTKPASPYVGQVIYMSDVAQTAVWDGTAWTVLAPIAGGRNVIINGAMDVWQRGTSFANASASPYYTVDRFQTYRSTGNAGLTASRQTSALDGFTYALRMQRDSGNTSTTDIILAQTFETQNVRKFHNKFVTLSFYARCGANFSSASSALIYAITTGTGTDGSIANGLTGQTNSASATATLTTTFQRFTVSLSAVLPTTKTQLGITLSYTPVGTASTNDWFEITGVQLEAGSVATPFEFEDAQVTLAKCQRYYWRSTNQSSNVYNYVSGAGFALSTVNTIGWIPLPVTMRTTPSAVEYSNIAWRKYDGALYALSAVVMDQPNSQNIGVVGTTTGLTANWSGNYFNNNTASGYIAFTAEL
jgi:hypothetical protein